MKYVSVAIWPKSSGIGISTDEHDTKEQAQVVCQMLHKNGLGGDGEVFPTHVGVIETCGYNASRS